MQAALIADGSKMSATLKELYFGSWLLTIE
jgi:hypothetical protein